MAYQCKCGNNDEFLEVFETAVDVVDGSGKFVKSEVRNVAYYICRECESEIPYKEFQPMASSIARR
jgi:hypothetical protein